MIQVLRESATPYPERFRFEEEHVFIDTASSAYLLSDAKTIDVTGAVINQTPPDWHETRDLNSPQPPLANGDTPELAQARWKLSRFITGEIVRRLTRPQLTAMEALKIRSLGELNWDKELQDHYVTLVQDQVAMERSMGPDSY